jgi:integrase
VSIYKRASGRYAVVIGIDSTGAPRRRSLGTFATKKEAERAEREALTARDRGIEIVPAKITLDQLFERFMLDAAARSLSGTTLHGYRQIWKRVEPIAGVQVAKLKPAHLSELYGQLARDGWAGGKGALSSRSIGHTHALLSTILGWAVRLELAARNVAEVVEPPKGAHKRAKPYERADALRLVEEASQTRYGPLVIFGFETGLRRGELAGLKWTDIDTTARAATIRGAIGQVPGKTWYKATKTESVARIALSDHALEALKSQRVQQAKDKLAAGALHVDEGFVFTPELGGTPSPGAISHAIRRVAARANLNVRGVHAMRHSTGSWLIRSGVDVRTVAALLRHSSASTTLNVYAHELEGAQAEAVKNLLGADCNRIATAADSANKKAR